MIDALQAPIDRLDTPGQTQILRKTQHRPGFLAGDHPSPLVGVQLVRPRLRLRALQHLPHDGDNRPAIEQDQATVSPRFHHSQPAGARTVCALDTPGPHGCTSVSGAARSADQLQQ